MNMEMVKAAGFDETFVDDWDTFVDCVTAMTKGSDTYGLGIGMQLGGFGEWYQRARAAGGRFLTPDLSAPAINTPEVVEATQQLVDFFAQGIAPPQGTFDYNTAPDAFIAGRLATYSSDLTIAAVLDGEAGAAHLRVGGPPLSAWLRDAGQLQRHRSLCHELKDAGQGSRLGGSEVLDERRAERPTGRACPEPIQPASTPLRWATTSTPRRSSPTSFDLFQKYSVGPEPFAACGTVEAAGCSAGRPRL